MTQITLGELAKLVKGQLIGDADIIIKNAAPIHAVGPDEITFVNRPEMFRMLGTTKAAAVLISGDTDPSEIELPTVMVESIPDAVAEIVCYFRPPRQRRSIGISPQAVVDPTATIGANTDIHPLACIADQVEIGANCVIYSGAQVMTGCKIADDVTIYPSAVLHEDTIIGPRCIINANSSIGANGFGYDLKDGRHKLSSQLGNVILEADVEIGACSTVDRGTYGPTVIGEGTKIDNQVMVAHNCVIGKHNLLCAQVGIAGSTTTGDYVVMAGQVGVRDHVHIGDEAVLGAMAGIMSDVPAKARWVGIPATPERVQMVQLAVLAKLPDMRRQLRSLVDTVENMANMMDKAAE